MQTLSATRAMRSWAVGIDVMGWNMWSVRTSCLLREFATLHGMAGKFRPTVWEALIRLQNTDTGHWLQWQSRDDPYWLAERSGMGFSLQPHWKGFVCCQKRSEHSEISTCTIKEGLFLQWLGGLVLAAVKWYVCNVYSCVTHACQRPGHLVYSRKARRLFQSLMSHPDICRIAGFQSSEYGNHPPVVDLWLLFQALSELMLQRYMITCTILLANCFNTSPTSSWTFTTHSSPR